MKVYFSLKLCVNYNSHKNSAVHNSHSGTYAKEAMLSGRLPVSIGEGKENVMKHKASNRKLSSTHTSLAKVNHIHNI